MEERWLFSQAHVDGSSAKTQVSSIETGTLTLPNKRWLVAEPGQVNLLPKLSLTGEHSGI